VKNRRPREIKKPARATLVLIGTLTAWFAFSASTTASQTVSVELLEKLNLSGYPSIMRPPDFQAPIAAGGKLSIRDLSGKVLLMNFWATWCHECRKVMPEFELLHREFTGRGLSVIGINARETPAAIRAYAKELGLTFPLVLDPEGRINVEYGVVGLPTTFLIGRDGRAIALAVGPREWVSPTAHAIFRALLVEPSVPERKQ
jgi:peroxiredoxin